MIIYNLQFLLKCARETTFKRFFRLMSAQRYPVLAARPPSLFLYNKFLRHARQMEKNGNMRKATRWKTTSLEHDRNPHRVKNYQEISAFRVVLHSMETMVILMIGAGRHHNRSLPSSCHIPDCRGMEKELSGAKKNDYPPGTGGTGRGSPCS